MVELLRHIRLGEEMARENITTIISVLGEVVFDTELRKYK